MLEKIRICLNGADNSLRLALDQIRQHGHTQEDIFLENDLLRALGAVECAFGNLSRLAEHASLVTKR